MDPSYVLTCGGSRQDGKMPQHFADMLVKRPQHGPFGECGGADGKSAHKAWGNQIEAGQFDQSISNQSCAFIDERLVPAVVLRDVVASRCGPIRTLEQK